MVMKQEQIISRHLFDYGNISSWTAYEEYGITRLSAVIFQLKKQGYMFNDEWVHTTNRYGEPTKYKKYIFIGIA
jgi:hypothetical protein